MKRFLLVAMSLALLGMQAHSAAEARQKQFNKLMIDKLKNAQKLLEGLALADFKKMEESAGALVDLSKHAEWFAVKTPRYEVHSNEFRRTAEAVAQKAKDKNIDGAALAYLEMTLTCVRCHQYVREVREARLPADLPALARPGPAN